jgi:GxxExxY protein
MSDSAFSPRSHEDHKDNTKIVFDDVSRQVVDAAFRVHQNLGTGLLESIYEECMVVEFRKRKIPFSRQVEVPIVYEGEKIPATYKLDLVVNNEIIIELKSVEKIIPVHKAQILTYMKTSGLKTGLLINFGEPYFKEAIKRFVL